MPKYFLLSALLVPFCVSEAAASCTHQRSLLALGLIIDFKTTEPQSVSLHYKHDSEPCKVEFSRTSRSRLSPNKISISERPKSGVLRLNSKELFFIYTAKQGFIGQDSFRVNLCLGKSNEKCKPLIYQVTVN